jgi:predicted transcriptional regulator
MTRQTTVRLPDELADEAETIASVHGTSVNQLIVGSLATEIKRVRAEADFMIRARQLLDRDRAIIDRLAE